MKRSILHSFIVLLLAIPAMTQAQGNASPVIYKDWNMVIESTTLIDVSYRIVKCTSVTQAHLMVFNENSVAQNAHFNIEFTNIASGEKFTKEINLACTKATIYKALCESDASLDVLKINLPANFNPMGISVKVTFKP